VDKHSSLFCLFVSDEESFIRWVPGRTFCLKARNILVHWSDTTLAAMASQKTALLACWRAGLLPCCLAGCCNKQKENFHFRNKNSFLARMPIKLEPILLNVLGVDLLSHLVS
jgi:hypothetical protein